MSAPVSPGELKRWSKVSLVRTLAALAFDLGVIAFAAVAAERVGGVAAHLLAIPFIGARQHALLGLTHEAAHFGLARSRRLNDGIGHVIARLFLFDFPTYRRSHLEHHKYLNTPKDPDWARYNAPGSMEAVEYRFPMRPQRLAMLLLGDLFGLRTLQLFAKVRHYSTPDRRGPRGRQGKLHAVLWYAALVALVYLVGWERFLFFWVIPIFTWVKMNLRLRLIAEHYCIDGQDGTRTVEVNAIERFFLWPHNTAYHGHHHGYPAVRGAHLPTLARRLGASWYTDNEVAKTSGLRGLLREVTTS